MNYLQSAQRIVVKVGSSTLTHDTGKLNLRRISVLVRVLSDLKNEGKELILVSSGAIAVGVAKLHLNKRPHDIGGRQACAAVGQCELMYTYDKLFAEHGYNTAQVLLTRDCVDERLRFQNVQNAFARLLDLGALPIVNENDTVSVEEIEFGDNDKLSAIVAQVVKADALIIMTDIDGLHAENPKENPDAALIHVVNEVTDETRAICGGKGSSRGTGGMITKIEAADMATKSGITTCIIDGTDPENIYRLMEGEEIGTIFPRR